MKLIGYALGLIKRVLLLGVLLVLIVGAALSWVIGSESGTRFALTQADQWLAPLTVVKPQHALINGLRLEQLHWQPESGPQVSLASLSFAWQWQCLQQRHLCIDQLSADSVSLSLPPAEPTPETPPRTDTLQLPEIELPIAVTLKRLALNTLTIKQGEQTHTLRDIALSLDAQGQQLTLNELALAYQQYTLQSQATLRLHQDYPLSAELVATATPLIESHPAKAVLSLSGDLRALQAQLDIQAPQQLQLNSTVNALAPELPLTAVLSWSALQWPLAGEPQYQAQNGTLKAEGNLNAGFDVSAQASLSGEQLPAIALNTQAQVMLDRAKIDTLSLNTLEGEVRATGDVSWQQGLKAQVRLTLQDIDTRKQWPDYPAQLAGALQTQFTQTPSGDWQLELPTLDLQGRWLEKPLTLKGAVSANSQDGAELKGIALQSGQNQALVSGRVHDSLDLQATLNFAALNELWPGLRGTINGQLNAKGPLATPSAQLDLRAEQVGFEQYQVQSLAIKGRINELFQQTSELSLSLSQAKLAGQQVQSATLSLTGTQAQHSLSLQAKATDAQADVSLNGAFLAEQQRYQGEFRQADITALGESLRLQNPLRFAAELDQASVRVQPHCWQHARAATLCLQTPFDSAKAGVSRLRLQGLSLRETKPYLPEDLDITGQLSADAAINWQPERPPQLDLKAVIDALTLELASGDQQSAPLRFRYQKAELRASTEPRQMRVGLALDSQDLGSIKLDAAIDAPQEAQSSATSKLSGQVALDGLSLAVAKSFVPDFDTLGGQLSLTGSLGGSLQAPSFNGSVLLDRLALAAESLPITVTSGQIKAQINGNQATLEGTLRDQSSALRLNGQAAWPNLPAFQATVNIDADNSGFPVFFDPLIEAKVAPAIKIRASDSGVFVRGQVGIPFARITAAQLPPGTPSPSSDVIVIDPNADDSAQTASSGLPLDVDIQVLLGEDISLSAYGFNSSLDGTLGVRMLPGKPPLLSGEVAVIDGLYKSYGQNLVIDEGRIYFAGPIQSAEIDAEAYRSVGAVKAGLQLSGPLTEPVAELVSTPSMSDDNILSYIVLGRALGQEGEASSEAALLTQAALSMGLKNSQGVAQDIAGSLGIENVQLELAGSGENSQVVVSGQINDRLSLKYGVGVFKPIPEISLTYDVSKNVYINMVQSTANAIDVFYSFEFDQLREVLQ